jgi:prophage regulatory protein
MSKSVLRFPGVQKLVSLSRSSIYFGIANGTFPAPIKLGARAVGWLESDIQDWLNHRVELTRNK